MRRFQHLILFACLFPLVVSAQIQLAELPKNQPRPPFSCGADAAHEALFQQNPALARQQAEADDLLYRKLEQAGKGIASPKNPQVTLPVVFHIIHNNGAENIADDQIVAALGHLNDAFAHTGYFSNEGEDSGIRFCLAKRTPEGLATSGITRTVSPLTDMVMESQDLPLKDLIRWDPTRYINIWVVASITSASQGPGVAGYAYLPFSHGGPKDGMVCEAGFLGFDPASNAVLIHEMGHYLGLYHTFESGCPNGDCLLDGDRVCDTPPDQAQHSVCPFNSCSTDTDAPAPNPFSADVDDQTWNFMDYSDFGCYAGFTAGQGDRMRYVVEFVRYSLLESDACQDPCTQLIDASFALDPPSALAGGTVQMLNASTGASQFEWYVNGVLISSAPAPAYTFNAPGVYSVRLLASNADANCTEEFTTNCVVSCPVTASINASPTQILPGESVSFNDNSVNATSWQWTVNGTPAGTPQNLNYQFNAPGIYTVALLAGNGFCNDQAAVAIQVEGPCGGLVKLGHYRSGDPFFPRISMNSTLFTTTGDIFGAGSELNGTGSSNGILVKWNSAAQLQWAKKADGRYFHKARETPDGNWVVYSVGTPCVTAKLTPDGNVLWARSFNVPGSPPAYLGHDHLAVLPNGDVALVINGGNFESFLFRLDADGNLLWQKKFNAIVSTNISPAADGSNNLWVYVSSSYYFVISPDGQQILEMKELNTLGNPGQQLASMIRGNQHPDGSFSLWASEQIVGPPEQDALVIFHFDAAGSLLWKKSFYSQVIVPHFVRYYPGDGWLITMNLSLKHLALRLNDDGSTRWTREFTGGGPAYVFTGFSGLEEAPDGRIAGMNTFPYDTAFYLLLFDPNSTDNCDLVDFPLGPGFELPVVLQPINKPVTNSNIPVADFPLVLTDAPLPFQAFCDDELPCVEICGNGFDDDYDGLPDCADPDCQCQGDNVCIPDASVSVDSMRCQGDKLLVHLRLCNTGGGVLPAGTPLQWYGSDPTAGTAALFGPAQMLPFSLPADSCGSWSLEIPLPPSGTVWGVLNDDGTLPTPFDLDVDFPVTAQQECDFSNNLFSVQFSFAPLDLDLGPDQTFCSSSVVVLHGGPGFARYRWANGSADSTFTAFGPGAYWLDAWDECGNLYTDTLKISLQTSLPLDLGADRIICPGDSLVLSVGGFDQVKWSPAAVLPCTDCAAMVFYPDTGVTLRVTGRLGNCFVSDSMRVSIAEIPLLDAVVAPAGCTVANGSIELAATGGTAPYHFTWSDGATGPSRAGLPSGEYIVGVAGAEGCIGTDTFTVPQTNAPTLTGALITNALCSGASNGSITATAAGGTPPYSFDWSGGSPGATLTGLAAGIYELTLSDAAGCSAVQQYNVGEPVPLSIQAILGADSCSSQTGSIQLAAGGGTMPLTFLWEDGFTGAMRSGLAAGDYIVSLSDAQGCSRTDTFTVAAIFTPEIANALVVDAACNGENTGAISITAGSGTPPYVFDWSNGASGNALSGLSAGQYSVVLSDANGCKIQEQFIVGQPAPLSLLAAVAADTCGQQSGAISLVAAGGTAPFAFNWSDGATGAQRNALSPGAYAVLISDAQGCALSDTFTVQQLSAAAITEAGVSDVACFGENSGSIKLTAGGGVAPYSFVWSNGDVGDLLAGLAAGDYAVTLSDALGCTAAAQYAVGTPAALGASVQTIRDTCGQQTGSIALSPDGGVPPYQFLWSNGATTEDLTGLPDGTYSITVTDANACIFTTFIAVQPQEIPPVFALSGEKITCAQPFAEAVASPATYLYQWQTPLGEMLNGAVQTLNAVGNYTITATNSFGCTGAQTLSVEADTLAPIAQSAAQQVVIPCDQSAVLLDGSPSDTGPGVALSWSRWLNGGWTSEMTGVTLSADAPGTYRLKVMDLGNGCTAFDTVQVLAAEGIDALWLSADSVSCYGFSDGRVRVDSVSGGAAPFEFALTGQHFSTENIFEGLPAGAYDVQVRDAAGCTASASVVIQPPAAISLELSASAGQVTAGEPVVLLAEIQPAGQVLAGIQWLPADLFPDQNRLDQSIILNEDTRIQLSIETEKGCTDTASLRIEVRQRGVYLPNAFSPGRPGNDGFTAFGGAVLKEIRALRVFDRWGELVFERQHFAPNLPELGWDGRFRGKDLPPGVYVYHLELLFANGETQSFQGSVLLVR